MEKGAKMTDGIEEKGIIQLADKAAEFLGKLVNPPLKELGGLMADKVRFWRFKNQVNIILQAKTFLEQKGIQPSKVPLKTLAPLLEHSSWEEDPDMQTKWASLLANAANPNYSYDIYSTYVDVLNQLSPLEGRLLDLLFNEYERTPSDKKDAILFSKEKICQAMNVSSEKFDILIGNLFRLNLLQSPASHGGVSIGNYPIVLRTYEVIQLTPLGCDFVRHCRIQ
jgi:hypothetical protein